MLRIIQGLPSDTLGISASGTVTPREYQDILSTSIERASRDARLLFIAGPGFKGFADGAPWEDVLAKRAGAFDFLRVAIVTSLPWLRAAVSIIRPLVRGDLAIFAPADLPAALQWLADGDGPHPHRSFLESEILGPSFTDIGQIVDAEDRRHDQGVARKQRTLRRKMRKSALMAEENLRADERRAP